MRVLKNLMKKNKILMTMGVLALVVGIIGFWGGMIFATLKPHNINWWGLLMTFGSCPIILVGLKVLKI